MVGASQQFGRHRCAFRLACRRPLTEEHLSPPATSSAAGYDPYRPPRLLRLDVRPGDLTRVAFNAEDAEGRIFLADFLGVLIR
jgi:hypothetical protein